MAAEPTRDEWLRLYEAAGRLKEAAPWQWMEEVDVFGVQDPETGEVGYVSIMGTLGQHLALALYYGAKALRRFWRYQGVEAEVRPEGLLEIRHLQASFEDRNQLDDADRAQIKDLGLKYRGRQAWPMFRSYRPGYCPWYLESPEVRFLTHAIDQALEMAARFREDPNVLARASEDSYLVRVPHDGKGPLTWEDQVRLLPPEEPETVHIRMDLGALNALERLPQSDVTLEADLSLAPICIGERGERPYYPYLLMAVEGQLGLVVGAEFLDARAGLPAMWAEIPQKLVRMLAAANLRPRRVVVSMPVLYNLLGTLVDDLGFTLEIGELPMLEQLKADMLQRFA